MSYPEWSYFPRNAKAPDWVPRVVEIVAAVETTVSTVTEKGPTSDAVLAAIAPGLLGLGFQVEINKAKNSRIRRPVLYGPNGREAVAYEIDAFHDGFGIALEVEAGRGAANNADYRDIVRASLILDAAYFVILMPQQYRSLSGERSVAAYRGTQALIEALYASQRLRLPFTGVLTIGY